MCEVKGYIVHLFTGYFFASPSQTHLLLLLLPFCQIISLEEPGLASALAIGVQGYQIMSGLAGTFDVP